MSRVKKNAPDAYEIMGEGSDDHDLDVMGDDSSEAEKRALNEVLGVFRPNEEFDLKRSAANMELVGLLAQFLTDYPAMRFGQALQTLGLVTADLALAEPQVQLKRAKAALKKIRR